MLLQVLTVLLAVWLPQAPAQAPAKTYNEAADAKQVIAPAVKSAATDDIRVLINWGANDDDACAKYIAVQGSRDVPPAFFSDEYRQVYVNVGHLDKNLVLAKAYGVTLEEARLPMLTVLDRNGNVVANVSARDFIPAGTTTFSAPLISTFLKTHQAPQPNDTANFENAVKQAKKDGKTVFVWFSAPW